MRVEIKMISGQALRKEIINAEMTDLMRAISSNTVILCNDGMVINPNNIETIKLLAEGDGIHG